MQTDNFATLQVLSQRRFQARLDAPGRIAHGDDDGHSRKLESGGGHDMECFLV